MAQKKESEEESEEERNSERLTASFPPSESLPSHNNNSQIVVDDVDVRGRESTLEDSRSISGVLRYCKTRILHPYLKLLGVMGLKPFRSEFITVTPVEKCELCTCVLNKFYIILVTILIILGYFLQYFTCFRRDRGFSYRNNSSTSIMLSQSTDFSWNEICAGNSIYIHILPSSLHLASFFYMVYLYRLHDDEQLPNLIERVFIQAAHTHSTSFSQRRLIRQFQYIFAGSFLWLVLSTSSLLIMILSTRVEFYWFPFLREEIKKSLVVLMAISNAWQDVIQLTVIVSYSIHCHLLSTYLNLIQARIRQHSLSLSDSITEIGELVTLLKYLNSDLGPGVGFLILLDISLSISGVVDLVTKLNNGTLFSFHFMQNVSTGLNTILWLTLFLFPVINVAKLSSSCKRVREIGHFVRMRPFGYHDVSQEELDSFLLYVSTLRLEVRILQIPLTTTLLSTLLAISILALLLWGLLIL